MKTTKGISSFFSVTAIAVAASAILPLGAQAADPNTWWVDDANYGAEGRDGSEANPFGSIHEALTNEACVAGDTIKVKPGVYDKDYDERTVTIGSTGYQMRSRRLLRAGRSCAISVIHNKGIIGND